MNYSIKLQLGDDIRRTSLAFPRYDLLCQIIRQLFPALKSDFAVRYVDEDGDSITVSTDLEMSEALKGRNSSGLVKFLVVAVEGTKPSATLPAATNTNNVKPQVQPLPNLFNQLPTFDVTPFLSGYVAPVLQQIQQQAQTQVQNMDLCSMWSQLQTLLSNPSTAAQIQPVLSTFQQLALQAQNQAQNVNWNGLTAQIEKVLQDPATIANAQVYQFVNMVKQMIPQVPVATTNTSTPSASIPNNNNQPSVVSHAAICDNCQQSITGIRFKCGNCADYDLCESCEAKRPHDEEHIFLKIYKPALICTRSALLANLYQSKPSEAHGKDAPRCPRRTQGLSSKFISDVTIPDGSETECGSKFVKTWRMRNDGSNAWPEGTVLKFVGGAAMSESATVPVKPLAVGEEVDVSVNMTAPSVPARYISYFRLCTPDGVRFGHRVWVDFITTAKNEPAQPEPVETQVASAPQEVAPVPTPVSQPVTPAPQPVATSPSAETAAPLSKQALLDICMEDDLKELASMGFTDKEKNKKLWKESKGDMATIVSRLLNNY